MRMQLTVSLEQILKDSWAALSKSKSLLWFGLFAVAGTAGITSNYTSTASDALSENMSTEAWIFIGFLIVLIFVLAIVMAIFSVVSSLSLVNGVRKQVAGEASGFRAALTVTGFWRFIGASIIAGLLGFALFIGMLLHLVLVASTGIGLFLLPFLVIGAFVGFFALGLLNYGILVFMISNIVVKRMSAWQAVKQALLQVWNNPLDAFVVSAIVSTIQAVALGVSAIIIFVVTLIIGGVGILWLSESVPVLFWIVVGLIGFFAAVIMAFARSVLVTFSYHALYRTWQKLVS